MTKLNSIPISTGFIIETEAEHPTEIPPKEIAARLREVAEIFDTTPETVEFPNGPLPPPTVH